MGTLSLSLTFNQTQAGEKGSLQDRGPGEKGTHLWRWEQPKPVCPLGKSLWWPGPEGSLSLPGWGLLRTQPLPSQDGSQRTPPSFCLPIQGPAVTLRLIFHPGKPPSCGSRAVLPPPPDPGVPLPTRAESGFEPPASPGVKVEVEEASRWSPGLGAGRFPPSGQAPPSPEMVGKVHSPLRCAGRE